MHTLENQNCDEKKITRLPLIAYTNVGKPCSNVYRPFRL